MNNFNSENCGLRLIPSNILEEWISSFSSVDPDLVKKLHIESTRLYEHSLSPTEDQFLKALGEEVLIFTD